MLQLALPWIPPLGPRLGIPCLGQERVLWGEDERTAGGQTPSCPLTRARGTSPVVAAYNDSCRGDLCSIPLRFL